MSSNILNNSQKMISFLHLQDLMLRDNKIIFSKYTYNNIVECPKHDLNK